MILRRARDFTVTKGLVLAGALVFAQVLPGQGHGEIGDPKALGTNDIIAELGHGIFDVRAGDVKGRAWLRGDGVAVLDMLTGQYHGTWKAFDGELCLTFDYGPVRGFSCHEVVAAGKGRFVTETGTKLRRAARALPLD